MLDLGSDFDDYGFSAYDEDVLREFDEDYRNYYFDDYGEDQLVEEECWHRPIASIGACHICDPDAVEWDVEDAWLDREDLVSDIDIYYLIRLSAEEELGLKLLNAGIVTGEPQLSARGRRRQWYQPGHKRRRQDHGTTHTSCRRNDCPDERPSRFVATRAAIKYSEGLNKITAEFELNYMLVGDEFDEDYARAVERQRTRLENSLPYPSSDDRDEYAN